MFKRKGLAAISVLAITALAACGGNGGTDAGSASSGESASSDEQVTLEFWETQGSPVRTELYEGYIEEFEKQNPNIKINYLSLPSDSYQQKIDTAIATNSTPDLIPTGITDIANWVAQDALEPLDEYFENSELSSFISQTMIDSARAVVPDGKLYFFPGGGLANVLWIRKDIFEAAGEDIPSTWDEFYAAAETMTDGSGQFGYIIRGGNGFMPQLLDAMYGQSGVSSLIDENGQSTMNHPDNVEVLERYVQLYGTSTATGDLNADFKAMTAQFTSGAGVMMHHNLGSYSDHVNAFGAENVVGLQPFESKAGPVTVSGATVLGPAIMSGSKHKEEAWKFIEFLMSEDNLSLWAQTLGYIPSHSAVESHDWVQDHEPMKNALEVLNDPNTQVLREPFYLPEYQQIAKVDLQTPWQKVLQGELSVQEFLDEAAERFTAAETAYRERVGN